MKKILIKNQLWLTRIHLIIKIQDNITTNTTSINKAVEMKMKEILVKNQ